MVADKNVAFVVCLFVVRVWLCVYMRFLLFICLFVCWLHCVKEKRKQKIVLLFQFHMFVLFVVFISVYRQTQTIRIR